MKSENPFTLKKKKDYMTSFKLWAWLVILTSALIAIAYLGNQLVTGKFIVVRAVAAVPDAAPQGLVKGRFLWSHENNGNLWSVRTSPSGSYVPVLSGNNEYVWVNLEISGHCEGSCYENDNDKRMDDVFDRIDKALAREILATSRTDFLVDNRGTTRGVALAVGRTINWPLVKNGIFIDKLEIKIVP